MPTQRPFLSNFLAAFRAHSTQLPKPGSLTSQTGSVTTAATLWTSSPSHTTTTSTSSPSNTSTEQHQHHHTLSSPRPIHPNKTNPQPQITTQSSDLPFLQHNVSPQTHLPRSPPSPHNNHTPTSTSSGLPVYGPPNKPTPSYPTCQEAHRRGATRRRGSDSSSDSAGFREVGASSRGSSAGGGNAAGEKWFIGGRTAAGEERYYKLSMVRRERSADRISADQLSL